MILNIEITSNKLGCMQVCGCAEDVSNFFFIVICRSAAT